MKRWADIRRPLPGVGSVIRGFLGRIVFRLCVRAVLWLRRPAPLHPEIRSLAALVAYLKGKPAPAQVACQVLSSERYLQDKFYIEGADVLTVAWHGPGLRYGARTACLIRHVDGGFSVLYDGWPGPRCGSIAGAASRIVSENGTPGARLLAWARTRPDGSTQIGT